MPFSQVFSGCHDREARPKLTSLTQTREWLKTLPDVSEDVELRRIHEAVHVLEKPTQQAVERICAQWQQAQWKNHKHLPVAVIVEELTEKVLDASNRAQRRVPRRGGAEQPAASSGAAQPAHDEEAMLKFTSLREVGAWLETLPDVEGDAELRMIQDAAFEEANQAINLSYLCGMAAGQEEKRQESHGGCGPCRADRESARCKQWSAAPCSTE